MAAATNSKIFLAIVEEKKKKKKQKQYKQTMNRHRYYCCCSICGKKLKKFIGSRTSQYPLSCWQCMILNMNS